MTSPLKAKLEDFASDNAGHSVEDALISKGRLAMLDLLWPVIEAFERVGHRQEPDTDAYDNSAARCLGFLDCCEGVIADQRKAFAELEAKLESK